MERGGTLARPQQSHGRMNRSHRQRTRIGNVIPFRRPASGQADDRVSGPPATAGRAPSSPLQSVTAGPRLREHLDGVRTQYQQDLASGDAGWVELPYALREKYPSAPREWPRQRVLCVQDTASSRNGANLHGDAGRPACWCFVPAERGWLPLRAGKWSRGLEFWNQTRSAASRTLVLVQIALSIFRRRATGSPGPRGRSRGICQSKERPSHLSCQDTVVEAPQAGRVAAHLVLEYPIDCLVGRQ